MKGWAGETPETPEQFLAELERRAEAEKARRAETASAQSPDLVEFHWLATIQMGPRLVTEDGVIGAVPGAHTRQPTTLAVFDHLKEKYESGFTVLFFSLEPNQLAEAGGR
ncbi:hypothetical protein [Streptomyces albus]|uniref:hypothetical protein n=1 Tax=Streptomyces albus TaxID=1888 RepID=UPI00345514E4